jgi:hypothetical protein
MCWWPLTPLARGRRARTGRAALPPAVLENADPPRAHVTHARVCLLPTVLPHIHNSGSSFTQTFTRALYEHMVSGVCRVVHQRMRDCRQSRRLQDRLDSGRTKRRCAAVRCQHMQCM